MSFLVPPKAFQGRAGGYPDVESMSSYFQEIHGALQNVLGMDEPLYTPYPGILHAVRRMAGLERATPASMETTREFLYTNVYGVYGSLPKKEKPMIRATLKNTFKAIAQVRYELDLKQIEDTL